jgi:hypothetical protein
MLKAPFFQLLDSSIALPTEPVEIEGAWSKSLRRVYKSATQLESGSGPFVEVVDVRWTGTLKCSTEIAVLALLATATTIHWVKAPTISSSLPVEVSLHAYAGYTIDRATFASRIADASPPGVPIAAASDLTTACALGPRRFTSGHVTCLAQASEAAFAFVVFPRSVVKVGRNHLWRVRDHLASSMPPYIRNLLTRGRAGAADPLRR